MTPRIPRKYFKHSTGLARLISILGRISSRGHVITAHALTASSRSVGKTPSCCGTPPGRQSPSLQLPVVKKIPLGRAQSSEGQDFPIGYWEVSNEFLNFFQGTRWRLRRKGHSTRHANPAGWPTARRYGYYSIEQELKSGAYLWNTPEGKTVLVTEVKRERTPPGFKDAVYKGEVTKCVKSLKSKTALGI